MRKLCVKALTASLAIAAILYHFDAGAIRRGESWTHMGIGAFERGDYPKALSSTIQAGLYCKYVDAPFYRECIGLARDGISIWGYAVDADDYKAHTYLYESLALVAEYKIQDIQKVGEMTSEKVAEVREYTETNLLRDFKDVGHLVNMHDKKDSRPGRAAADIDKGRHFSRNAPVKAVVGRVLRDSASGYCLKQAEKYAKCGEKEMAAEYRAEAKKYREKGEGLVAEFAKAAADENGDIATHRECMADLRSGDSVRGVRGAKTARELRSHHAVLAALEHKNRTVIEAVRKAYKVGEGNQAEFDVDQDGFVDLIAQFSDGNLVSTRTINLYENAIPHKVIERSYENGQKVKVSHTGGRGGHRELHYCLEDGKMVRILAEKLAKGKKKTVHEIFLKAGSVEKINYDEDADGKVDAVLEPGRMEETEQAHSEPRAPLPGKYSPKKLKSAPRGRRR
ncbi:hypothetical protein ACFL1X_11120 [Candidatus Hydrogenedentota bacterium]